MFQALQTFVVSVSETVIVNGTPRLAIDMGGSTVFADYVAGSGSATLVFQYSVRPGDNDADGIAVSGLLSNGATLRDNLGNDANLGLTGLPSTAGVQIRAPLDAGDPEFRVTPTPPPVIAPPPPPPKVEPRPEPEPERKADIVVEQKKKPEPPKTACKVEGAPGPAASAGSPMPPANGSASSAK